MKVGDLVRDPVSGMRGLVVGEVLPGANKWFVQWVNGDTYSLWAINMEVISESR